MKIEEKIKRYLDNAEYERTHGNLQGCLEFRQLADWLEELKQLREQTRWIPVSERLPEDNTLVLVTVKVRNRKPKARSGYYYMNGHFLIDNGDSWEAGDKGLIAWMPSPLPYKQEVKE